VQPFFSRREESAVALPQIANITAVISVPNMSSCYHRPVTNQHLKWWHVRWRWAVRPAIVLGKVIGVLCLIAAIGYGVMYLIAPWLSSQHLSKVDPRLSLVPIDLPTKVEAPLSTATIDCYGFRVPLPREKISGTIEGDWSTTVLFRDGGTLTIHNSRQNPTVLEFVSTDRNTEKLLGKETTASKFKLMQAAMWTTPDQAKWWKLRTPENERVEFLLLLKSLSLSVYASIHSSTIRPIYAISAGSFRGFQIGNADAAPYDAHVDLFDGANRYLRFDVTGSEGHGPVLTQAEINAMVASIRPISAH
jgi:hypothetical protein